MAGHSPHPARGRIVHDPAQHGHLWTLTRPAIGRAALGRRDPRRERRRRIEHRVLHPERLEDAFAREAIEGQPAHALDDVAEEEEVDVAVDEALARPRRGHFVDGKRDRRLVAHPRVRKVDVWPEPGDVREQVTDR